MNRQALDELKQQIPLLDYLQAHHWRPARPLHGGRWMGLCPLHRDHQPSFLLDPTKNLFYCYGCGVGGDVIRFAQLYHQVNFPQALTLLQQWRGWGSWRQDVVEFYRMQLHRHGVAVEYLAQRGIHSPEVIEHMRIGYAPGGCLRTWQLQMQRPLSGSVPSRLDNREGSRRVFASSHFPPGGQPLWPQYLGFGAAPSVFARLQGRLVWLGASPALSGSHPRGRPFRLRRSLASGLSPCHLLPGNPSQWAPVSAAV
jgi:hypothetical protein